MGIDARGKLMTLNTKVRALQFMNHLFAVYGIWLMIITGQYHWLWVVLISYLLIGPINISVTLHRLLTHKSFETYDWLEKTMSYLTVFSTLGPTITWVGLHRYHHANPDTETDPHSPYDNGKLTARKIFSAWTGYGWEIPQIPSKFVRDIIIQKHHKFILENYFKIIFIGLFLLFLINPLLPLYVYFIPTVMAFHGVNMINICGHAHGYRDFDTNDKSTNSWITQIIAFEGWHNNHHHKPSAWNMSVKWWEVDPLSWVVRLIKK
jgi:stearoyl-CoA desaturase (delta-9 desaturase)